MALCDPGMIEFAQLVLTEAREHGLLLSNQAVNNNLRGHIACALGTQGCTGNVHEATMRRTDRNLQKFLTIPINSIISL